MPFSRGELTEIDHYPAPKPGALSRKKYNTPIINDKAFIYEQYGDKIILGVEPDVHPNPNMSDADAAAAAKRLVAKYGPKYEKKPVIAGIFQAPNAYVETIYEESRKLFG